MALLQLPQLRTRLAVAIERPAEEMTAQDFRTVTLQLPHALQLHVLVRVSCVHAVVAMVHMMMQQRTHQGTGEADPPGPLLTAWALLLGQLLSLDTLDGERRAIATALREDTRCAQRVYTLFGTDERVDMVVDGHSMHALY